MQKSPRKAFNELTPREWTLLSKSVWNDISSTRERHHLEHGATFSEALAKRVITMYSKEGDQVLDPFLGVGTTLTAAKKLNREAKGFELYSKYVKIAKDLLTQDTLFENPYIQDVYEADCRAVLDYVQPNSVQLTLTSPPYANFIHRSVRDRQRTHKKSILVFDNVSVVKPYGDDPSDFGNLDYDTYLREVHDLMIKLHTVTKPGGYNVWVVKDHRDPQNSRPYIPIHVDIARAGESAGFAWHDLIVWDQNEQRRLVLLGYPSVFYVNINHTFLVVLRKPARG